MLHILKAFKLYISRQDKWSAIGFQRRPFRATTLPGVASLRVCRFKWELSWYCAGGVIISPGIDNMVLGLLIH